MEGPQRVLLASQCPFYFRVTMIDIFYSCSCFNAFSRVDMRVDVKIPGGVLAYVIDLRGERYAQYFTAKCADTDRGCRHDTTPELWQETYLSAILRAIIYGDDPTYWLEAYRRLDPITTREGEVRFLEAADALFSQGMLASLEFDV